MYLEVSCWQGAGRLLKILRTAAVVGISPANGGRAALL